MATTQSPTLTVSESPSEKVLRKAEKLFQEEHWADARAAYDEARDLETDWRSPRVRLAVEGAVACSLKLKLWDDAISRAEEFIAKTKGSFAEAVGEPAGRLAALADQLRATVEDVRRVSAVVRKAGDALARHMSGLMQTVHSALSRARVYSRRGQLATGAQSRFSIDVTS